MNVANVKPPLSNVQMELFKLFAGNVSEEGLSAINSMIARYLLEKARGRADEIWDERGYTDEKLKAMLNID